MIWLRFIAVVRWIPRTTRGAAMSHTPMIGATHISQQTIAAFDRPMAHRGLVPLLSSLATVVVAALLTGSQASASASRATIGGQPVLAHGSGLHAVNVTLRFDSSPQGPTSNLVVIGQPGSTDEVDDNAHLPATAVMRTANQLAARNTTGTNSLTARFTADRPGTYPVFLFSSGDLGCASSTMVDETVAFDITQVGVVDIR
jgi:hypothetical protein